MKGGGNHRLPDGRQAGPATTNQNIGSDYTDEERIFLVAIDRYKRKHRRPFPTWREVLLIVKSLGYRQVDPPVDL